MNNHINETGNSTAERVDPMSILDPIYGTRGEAIAYFADLFDGAQWDGLIYEQVYKEHLEEYWSDNYSYDGFTLTEYFRVAALIEDKENYFKYCCFLPKYGLTSVVHKVISTYWCTSFDLLCEEVFRTAAREAGLDPEQVEEIAKYGIVHFQNYWDLNLFDLVRLKEHQLVSKKVQRYLKDVERCDLIRHPWRKSTIVKLLKEDELNLRSDFNEMEMKLAYESEYEFPILYEFEIGKYYPFCFNSSRFDFEAEYEFIEFDKGTHSAVFRSQNIEFKLLFKTGMDVRFDKNILSYNPSSVLYVSEVRDSKNVMAG